MPIGVPSSSPRSVSMIGVNGWYSANQRSPAGIESVGTNPLPRNGRSTSGIGRLLAASTVLAARPKRDRQPVSAKRDHREDAGRREPLDRRWRWAGTR